MGPGAHSCEHPPAHHDRFHIAPNGDEAYYYDLGSRFHLSYYDHPPATFWLAALGGSLGMHAGFVAARLPFILMSSASTWLMFLVTRRLFGAWAGFYAALLLNLTVYSLIGAGVLALPEGPLVLFWLACSWYLVRIFFDRESARSRASFAVLIRYPR